MTDWQECDEKDLDLESGDWNICTLNGPKISLIRKLEDGTWERAECIDNKWYRRIEDEEKDEQ